MSIDQKLVNALDDLELEALDDSEQDWEDSLTSSYGMTEVSASGGRKYCACCSC